MHKDILHKRTWRILQASAVIVLLGIFCVAYRWNRVRYEREAQREFAGCLKEYTNTLTAQTGHQNWNMIVGLFELGAQKYRNTSLAPFFIAYQAQALIKNNQLSEAAVTMDRAVSLLDLSHDFYYVYALKAALMHLDLEQESSLPTEKIERMISTLAENKNNKQRDQALYYLGRYCLAKGDNIRAREALQQLSAMTSDNPHEKSPWAEQAQYLLKQVIT